MNSSKSFRTYGWETNIEIYFKSITHELKDYCIGYVFRNMESFDNSTALKEIYVIKIFVVQIYQK